MFRAVELVADRATKAPFAPELKLHARITEAGTLELEAVPRGTNERWKVEFPRLHDALEAFGKFVHTPQQVNP